MTERPADVWTLGWADVMHLDFVAALAELLVEARAPRDIGGPLAELARRDAAAARALLRCALQRSDESSLVRSLPWL